MFGVNAVPLLYPKSAHPISSASRNKKLGRSGLELMPLSIPAMIFGLAALKVWMQMLRLLKCKIFFAMISKTKMKIFCVSKIFDPGLLCSRESNFFGVYFTKILSFGFDLKESRSCRITIPNVP